jgi:hypothetical protein
MAKIILAPTAELAAPFHKTVTATVEAEYGSVVVEGSQVTLAHHAEGWTDCPPPCLTHNGAILGEDDLVLVSHLDLDTIGGIMALEGVKPTGGAWDQFWVDAGFVDLNGPHHVNGLKSKGMLQAYWAWSSALPRTRYTEVTEVTDVYEAHRNFFLGLEDPETKADVYAAGQAWASAQEAATEACLVSDGVVRSFVTDKVFCNAAYWSPRRQALAEACVSLNTTSGAVTVSFADGGKRVNARDLVQRLWGPEAGGHAGIAGSPRGTVMTPRDAQEAVRAVEAALHALV